MKKIPSSEITPEHIYLSRRRFMVGAGSLAAGAVALSACAGMPIAPAENATDSEPSDANRLAPADAPDALGHEEPFASSATDELGDPLNSYQEITNYNNFYEFSLDKGSVNPLSKDFNTVPLGHRGYRIGQQSNHIRVGRHSHQVYPGRAHLSAALRGSLVDGDSMGRFPDWRVVEGSRSQI